ncbi:MAG: ABC transporter permease [Wenzhouxiangellaceae bacterium]
MGTRLNGLLVKEFAQLLRDRVILVLILWLYTVEVVICAYALSLDVENMPLAVVDDDQTPISRELADAFSRTEVFTHVGQPAGTEAVERWLQEGRAQVAIVIPKGFQRDLERGAVPELQLLLDGTYSNLAAQARGYALQIASRFGAEVAGVRGTSAGAVPVPRVRFNPDQTYTAFMVLSMIALGAFMVGMLYPAASIVREKEAGTIEQLRVTPIRTWELFAAKSIPTLAIGLLSVFPSLLIVWWFGVPMRGSLPLFLGLTAIFLLSAISLGVLIASVSHTQQQALLLAFFGLFPIMLLSGTLAPMESMPDILQTVSLASPLRHYMDVILGVFLKGVGLDVLWPQALVLLGWGLALFLLAAWIFRRSFQA